MLKKFDAYDGVSFCGGLVFFAPVALLVRTQAGLTEAQFLLLQALLSAAIFIGEVPAGLITDRIGYQKTLVLSQAATVLGRTLLMLGYLLHSPALFVVEALVTGAACCFASGSGDAYLYEVYGREQYVAKMTQAANYGTAGFILSTLVYVVLYRAFGITGLLAATVATSAAGFCFSLALPREDHHDLSEGGGASLSQLLAMVRKGRIFVALSSVFSVAGLLINFFYAEKLLECGLELMWMSPIIFGYSLVGMLAKPILGKLSGMPSGRILGIFCGLGAMAMITFGFTNRAIPVVAMMVLLPLLLSIPGYCLAEQQNLFIDRFSGGKNRAASLSVLNMGVNLVEIAALFASAALAGLDVGMCFLAVGLTLLVFGLPFLFQKSK